MKGNEVEWSKGQFDLDELGPFEGYHFRARWNGFACPFFTLEVGKKVAEAMKPEDGGLVHCLDYLDNPAPDEDYFIYQSEPEQPPEDYDQWSPVVANIDGEELKLYPIGTWSWVWKERQ